MKNTVIYLFSIYLLVAGCTSTAELERLNATFEVFALFPTEGIGDQSFVDIAYSGMERAKQDFSFKVNYITPSSFEEGEDWINNLKEVSKSIDTEALIIIVGTQYMSALKESDALDSDNKILFIGGTLPEHEHLAAINHHTYATSYLSSFVSIQQRKLKTGVVIAALDTYFLNEYIDGFNQGIEDAGGETHLTQFLSDDFSGFEMPDSAYQLTQKLLPENDLIFALSAGSNFGIINAVRDYTEQRYVVGVDADQSWMGLSVVTGSVIKHIDTDIYEYIQDFSEGIFESGNITRTLENNKTEFLVNPLIIDKNTVTPELINLALEKEKNYLKMQE